MDHVDRILSQWKQVRPDLDVAPMETVGRINRLSSLLRHEMEKTWKLHGLNAASFDMLAALRRSDSTQGLSPIQRSVTGHQASRALHWKIVRCPLLAISGLFGAVP